MKEFFRDFSVKVKLVQPFVVTKRSSNVVAFLNKTVFKGKSYQLQAASEIVYEYFLWL